MLYEVITIVRVTGRSPMVFNDDLKPLDCCPFDEIVVTINYNVKNRLQSGTAASGINAHLCRTQLFGYIQPAIRNNFV